ncbi:MAG TPA: nuclear transport factor 2 family protein [Vicinamibacterales bacterium]|nr:nuclear transport factor 2 family protein [Vicinamibacterales bacterium]
MSMTWLLFAVFLQATRPGSAEAELLALESVWNEAHLRSDAAALEQLWANDLVVTVPRMAVLTRDDAVAMLRSGRIKFQRYESSGTRARVYGQTAIVMGKLERVRERNGQVAVDHWQFTKVYERQQGKWRVVAFHASEAPEQR